MKDKIFLVLKGFLLGIANIIPGVSGGTLAITLGIYNDLIGAISHFFKNLKKNLGLLIPLGIGMVAALLLGSKVVTYCLDKFTLPTTLFFIGLIVGGIPLLTKKLKGNKTKPLNLAVFLLTFSIVMIMTFLNAGNNAVDLTNMSVIKFLILIVVGMVAAATMVIPGVSGSFVLMLLGYYIPVVGTVGNLTNFSELGHNLLILAPFGIGVALGIVGIAKLIEFLLKKYEVPTYYGIIGFVTSSVIGLGIGLIGVETSTLQVLAGLVLFVSAFVIGYKLGDE
jgi:putative membrane protein